jgi:hypothetical protein
MLVGYRNFQFETELVIERIYILPCPLKSILKANRFRMIMQRIALPIDLMTRF